MHLRPAARRCRRPGGPACEQPVTARGTAPPSGCSWRWA